MDDQKTGPERGTETARPPEAASDTSPPEAAAAEGVRGPPPWEGAPPEMERSSDIRVVVHYDEAEDAWRVRGGPSDAAYPAREKAVARARTLAHENRAVLVIYDEDGTIQEQQDYGTMGTRPSPEEDVTGEKGTEATSRAEERSMHRG